MASTINASNGAVPGLISTGDASGVLQLQTNNGVTAVTIGTNQAATFAGNVTVNGTLTANGQVIGAGVSVGQTFFMANR
jgi:phage baseplate assembly protein gpV